MPIVLFASAPAVATTFSLTDLIVIFAAVIVGSLVKSVTGFGLPLIALPVMSLFIPTQTAIVLLCAPNLIQNFVLAERHRAHFRDVSGLATFCIVGIAGAVLGTLTLGVVPDWITQLALVTVVAVFLVSRVFVPHWSLSARDVRRFNIPIGVLAGISQGAIGASGPIVGAWYTARKLPRDAFIFAISTVFFLTGLAQTIVLVNDNRFHGQAMLTVTALLCVVVLATVPIGAAIRTRVSIVTFERVVLVLLAASCISIVLKLLG